MFSSEDISFVTASFIAFTSIPLQISRKLCYQTEHWGEMCNSVSCIDTSKCSFTEGFFPVLIWGHFLFHLSPQWAPKYHFAEHKITELANSSKKGRVELCVMCPTPESNHSVSFSPVIIWGYFLFHHGPLWAPKSLFTDFTKTELANFFLRTQL